MKHWDMRFRYVPGIRIGELCALEWNDIDLQNRMIRINKTLQRIRSENRCGKRDFQGDHHVSKIREVNTGSADLKYSVWIVFRDGRKKKGIVMC